MGKQNFIQGGFKGKVGNVIGAGWKDILTIRSYTKPANPKTERQKTVRNAFALKVKASQLANQCNYGSSLFSSTSNTSWGLRMAAASSFYAENKNILQFVPLIPYGYTPDYPTSADPQAAGGAVVLSWDTADDISGRSVNVLIWALNGTSAEYEPVIIAGTVAGSSGAWAVTVSLPAGYSIGEDSYLAAVSSDDASFSDKTLYQPPIAIGTSIVDVPFTLSLASGPTWTSGNDYVLFTFTPSETLSDAANLTPTSSAYGVLQGDFVTDEDTAAAQVISNVVTVAVPITLDSLGQRPLFVSGSSLTLGAFAYADDTYRYIFEGTTFSLAETATQQVLIPSSTAFGTLGSRLQCAVKSNVSTATLVSAGSISYSSVNTNNLTVETNTVTLNTTISSNALLIYSNLSSLLNYGSVQTASSYTAPIVQLNGVNYSVDMSAPTISAGNDIYETFITPASSDNASFITNATNGWMYIDVAVADLPTISEDLTGSWYDSFECSWADIDVTVISASAAVDGSPSSGYVSLVANLSYPTTSENNATFIISNGSEKALIYTVPNSGGFEYQVVVQPFTASFTLQPS